MRSSVAVAALLLSIACAPREEPPAAVATESAPDAAQSLVDAEREYASAADSLDVVTALSRMFSDAIIMPTRPATFSVGRTAARTALASTPTAPNARVHWIPARVGVSGDGSHGFSYGYMRVRAPGEADVHFRYLAYWVREAGTWRVVAYNRAAVQAAPIDSALAAPSLPAHWIARNDDPSALRALERELMHAEGGFSDRAQQIGLGHAFAEYGHPDAVNMGPAATGTFVVGASEIARLVGGDDMAASPVTWSADTAIVASSGDLGVTFGRIVPKASAGSSVAPVGGSPAAAPPVGAPFFTIWRRAGPGAPWRYIAE